MNQSDGFPIFKIDPFGNIVVYSLLKDETTNEEIIFRYGINPSEVDDFFREGYSTYGDE